MLCSILYVYGCIPLQCEFLDTINGDTSFVRNKGLDDESHVNPLSFFLGMHLSVDSEFISTRNSGHPTHELYITRYEAVMGFNCSSDPFPCVLRWRDLSHTLGGDCTTYASQHIWIKEEETQRKNRMTKMEHTNESCHVWMSHVTYEYATMAVYGNDCFYYRSQKNNAVTTFVTLMCYYHVCACVRVCVCSMCMCVYACVCVCMLSARQVFRIHHEDGPCWCYCCCRCQWCRCCCRRCCGFFGFHCFLLLPCPFPVRIYVFVYMHIHIYVYANMYTFVFICIYMYIYICMIYIYKHKHIYMSTYIYTYVYTYINIYMYVIYVHIHVYIYTN